MHLPGREQLRVPGVVMCVYENACNESSDEVQTYCDETGPHTRVAGEYREKGG